MKPALRPLITGAILIGLLGVVSTASSAEVKIEEQVVGPANAGGVYAVSPRGAHVAYAATKGSRLVVIVDGVEGPVFDELFEPGGKSFFSPQNLSVLTASAGGQNASTVTPVIYSSNGLHYAYAGRQSNEYVIIHDGKEVARGLREKLSLNNGGLMLSPDGRFVYFMEMEKIGVNAKWRLVFNGKPGPWSSNNNGMLPVVFSADDTRYAYNAASENDGNKQILVVDGKDAGYVGLRPVFTADGTSLLSISPATTATPKASVLIDGKPVLTPLSVDKIIPAPTGRRWGVIVRTKMTGNVQIPVFVLDGKEVPGTDGAQNVWFSPDGKHYAVHCVNAVARSSFMVVDGKKGIEYQGITDTMVYWTPDSSKVIYLATSGGRSFVVVDGQELPVATLGGAIQMAEQGSRYGFATRDGANRNFTVIVDGQSVLPPSLYPAGDSLTFSADGSRYAYLVGPIGRNEITGLVVDGKLFQGLTPDKFAMGPPTGVPATGYLFSRDGKHIAHVARGTDPNTAGLYVDGKLVHPTRRGVGFPAFTPDGQHLFWATYEVFPDRPRPYLVVYADGKPTVRVSEIGSFLVKGSWDMGDDGILTLLAVDGDVVKRYRLTPAPDMNVAKLMTNTEATAAKVKAEGESTQKKAVEEAAAAKAKAETDAADAKAAAAKQKSDAAAAAAARQQAIADAIAAKNKARQEALEAKKKARQQALDAAAAARSKKK